MNNYYYRIALSEYDSGLYIDRNINEIQESEGEKHKIEMNVRSQRSYQSRKFTVVIVFSAMVLESFICQYGKQHLGASYYEDHLDRLDLSSKWIVVPQMVIGSTIKKSGQAYEALRKLIKDRNHLVHNKWGESAIYSSEYYERVRDGADNAIFAIKMLLRELDELHKGKTHYVELVLSGNEYFA